ncbi:MAG: ParB-like nuclease domain-containing protein [Gammaproteobacteria bacterium]|nr:ParB-like nuclease domain-containing protein [Gammaproteobacteria bacterium]
MDNKDRANNKLKVVEVAVKKLKPNPWNPNKMSQKMRSKLKAFIKRQGFCEPMVVRPKGKGYQILGGFHRWQIAKELGYQNVPCVIVENLDDKHAKILSINLNSMHGESVPSMLSSLLNELHLDIPLGDLELVLPYDKEEITDFLTLLQLPQGFGDELQLEAERVDSESPTAVTLVLDRKQLALWDKTIQAAREEVAGARNPKARTLELICAKYLAAHKADSEGAESKRAKSSRAG